MRMDIDLNFEPHPMTGDLPIKRGRQAIEQSIKNLILTNFYERGFNVELGSNVRDSLFENYTPLLRQTLEDNIKRVARNFEPDVEIYDVVIKSEDGHELVVDIFYVVFNDPTVRSISIALERTR